jgi:hypothetical protein
MFRSLATGHNQSGEAKDNQQSKQEYATLGLM